MNPSLRVTPIFVLFVSPSAMGRDAAERCLATQFDLAMLPDISDEAVQPLPRPPYVVVVLSFLRKREQLVDLVQRARARFPEAPLVAVGPFSSREEVLQAMTGGATACVSTDGGIADLSEAIATVQHRTYVCPHASALLREVPRTMGESRPLRDGHRLTPRQMQILRMIADGCTDREVAKTYRLSVRTVNTHRANIMAKLRVRNVTQLVRRANQLGLLADS